MQSPASKKPPLGPVATGMILLGFILFGILSFFKIQFGLFPSIVFPGLTVSVENPGKDVYEIEEVITIPLEEAISSIGGIESLDSVVERGKTETTIEFENGSNLDLKSLEIREVIDPVVSRFPRDVHKPIVYKYDPDERPAMIVTLQSKKFDFIELRSIADHEVKRRLENIKGISKIIVSGGKVREVIVACDMEKLRIYGLDLKDIQKSIQNHNLDSSLAKVDVMERNKNVILKGKFKEIQDIEILPIFSKTLGSVIRLRDVGEIHYSYRDDESGSRLNGNENISVYVYKTASGNLMEISKEVKGRISGLKIQGVSFDTIYDRADSVKKSYINITLTSLSGFLLLSIWILWRDPFQNRNIIFLFLFQFLFSFLVICLVLFLFEWEFDLIIFSSLILGFSASILLHRPPDQIVRKYDSETSEVVETIFLMTLLLAAFVPLFFIDPEIGSTSLKLGIFTCVYLSLSKLIESSTLRFIDQSWGERLNLEKYLTFQRSAYSSIRFIFPRLKLWLFILIYIFVVGLSIFYFFSIRKELYYATESAKILGYIELPSGTGFAYTNKLSKKIEKKILEQEEIKDLTSKIDADHAFLILELKEGHFATESFIEKLKRKIGNTNPAFVYFSSESDSKKFREITIDVLGDDVPTLDKLVRKFSSYSKGIWGVEEVILRYKNPREELKLFLDEKKSSDSGLSSLVVGTSLQMAIQGAVVSKFIKDSREMDIRLRFSEKYRNSKKSLSEIYLKGRSGNFVPLAQITRSEESESPVKLFRKNKKRSLSFSLRVGSISYEEIYSKLQEYAKEILPENYYIEMTRNIEKTLEINREFSLVAIITMGLLYMIIASYYESFRRPTKIFLLLGFPLSFSFSLLGLLSQKLDLALYLAFLFLSSILILQIVREGKTGSESHREGFRAFICLFFFYLPQILLSSESGGFIGKLEITILVGFSVSLFLLPHLKEQMKR